MPDAQGFEFEFTQVTDGQRCRFSAYLPMDVARALSSALGRVATITDVKVRRVTQTREDVADIP